MRTFMVGLVLGLGVALFAACGGSDGGASGTDTVATIDAGADATAAPDAADPEDLAPDLAPLSTDATLVSLVPALGALAPAFAPDETAYVVQLPFGATATPVVTAAATHPAATVVTVDAANVASADEAARTTTVTVTAEDGATTRAYAVRFDVSPYKTLHDFQVESITGETFDLATLAGKKVLVVNVASYCGYTPQYPKLQQLYATYGPDQFVVVAFPANDFNGQEPDSNATILEFATTHFGVTFPLMAKISVKGAAIHPVYAWLTQKSQNGVLDSAVQWNFQKFMVDEAGHVVDVALPPVDPLSAAIVDWITGS